MKLFEGAVVQLKSGGPLMTVKSYLSPWVDNDGKEWEGCCTTVWITEQGYKQRGTFPPHVLKIKGDEK